MKKKYLMLAMALCMAVPAMGGCGSDTQTTTVATASEEPTENDVKTVLKNAEKITDDDDVTITIDKSKMNDEGTKCTVTGSFTKKDGIKLENYDFQILFKYKGEEEGWTCKNTDKNLDVSYVDMTWDIPEFKQADYTALLKDYDGSFTFDYDTYINYADVAGNLTVQSTEYEGTKDTYFDAVLEGSYDTDYVTYNYTLDVSYSFDEDKEKWYVSYAYKSGVYEEYHLNDMTVEDVQKAFDNDAFDNVDALEYLEMDDEWWYKMYLCDMTVIDVLAFEIDNEEQTATATVEAEFENDADEYGTFNITLDLEMKFDTYDNEWEVSSYDSDTVKITNDNIKEKQDEEETTEAEEEEETEKAEMAEMADEENDDVDACLEALEKLYNKDFADEYPYLALVYLDDDEYPELFVSTGDTENASFLLVYDGKNVSCYGLEGIFAGFNEKTGRFVTMSGFDVDETNIQVYALEDKDVDNVGVISEITDGDEVTYKWNDEELTEDELYENIAGSFDFDDIVNASECTTEDFDSAKELLGLQ